MNNSEYDPSHKTSSVTSTSSGTSSIWDPLPSLYTGRANSVSSAYELDDLPQEEPTPLFVDGNFFSFSELNEQHLKKIKFLEFNYNPVYSAKEQQLASTLSSSPDSIIIAANNNQEENTFNDYLNSFLDTTISNTPDVTSTLIKEVKKEKFHKDNFPTVL